MSRIIKHREIINRETGELSHVVVQCDCGELITCFNPWTNDCDKCGREYNGSGQLLADRSQWGEETGERF